MKKYYFIMDNYAISVQSQNICNLRENRGIIFYNFNNNI